VSRRLAGIHRRQAVHGKIHQNQAQIDESPGGSDSTARQFLGKNP